MNWKAESACLKVSSRQRGLITREQALNLGLSEDAVFRRVASGRWWVVFPGVYAISGSPDEWMQILLGGCFWGAGVASHRAASAVWGLEGFRDTPVEITTQRRVRSPGTGVVIHRQALDRKDRTIFNGIPVTTPSRTLLDLAAVADLQVVEAALQDALRKGLTTMFRLRLLLSRSGGKGKPGVGGLRRLVGDNVTPRKITETRLETRLLKIISDADLPLPSIQYAIRDGRHLVARLDFAYPGDMFGIEADSFSFHSGPVDFRRDREKSNALTLRGWRILRVTWDDLVSRPSEVIESIRVSLAFTPRNSQPQTQRINADLKCAK